MKVYRHIWLVAALALLAARCGAQDGSSAGRAEVSGEVVVVEPGATRHAENDASKVVVWLVPEEAVQPVRVVTDKAHYRLVQQNKRFEPGLLVVPVGTQVDFPNLDPWFHNVFSLYRGKRFDLGLYQAGAQRSVRFDRPGPSYLFCNIHPEMTGVVLAVDSQWFAVTDRSGHYKIPGVAPGRYVMHVWYEKATPESLQGLQRKISVEEGMTLPSMTVVDARRNSPEHRNKYGESYDPEGIKTDYLN
jgi:plastocyanin